MPLESVVDVLGLCPPPEPYSRAVRAGDTLYVAGQVALDDAFHEMPGAWSAPTPGWLDRRARIGG